MRPVLGYLTKEVLILPEKSQQNRGEAVMLGPASDQMQVF